MESPSLPYSIERRDRGGTVRNEKVVNCLYQNPGAIFRLICFPWIGGGSTYFARWGQNIHSLLEVHSIRLAGRESRQEEPFASDIHQIVDEIVCALLPILQDKPFAFFGHSMGSYIAFMTALRLKEEHKQEPMHLFVSSTTPPHSKKRVFLTEDLSEEEISHQLVQFGGTAKGFVNDKEFLKQISPKLMADGQMVTKYIFEKPSKPVLSCDLTCFFGSEDVVQDLEAWKDLTSGTFDIHKLPGNHFYLMEPSNDIFIKNYITKCLELSMLA